MSLAVLAIVAYAPPVRASTSVPTLSVGDYWVYNMTGGGPIPGLPTSSATWRMDMVGTDSVAVNGTSYTAYHLKLNITLSVTSGGSTTTISVPGDEWFRTSDLASVKESVAISLFGTSFSSTQSNNPPPGLQWPLTGGATWTDSYVSTSVTTSGSITTTTYTAHSESYSVQADMQVTVPAGTFTATPVKDTSPDGSYTVTSWSASTGAPASIDTYDSVGGLQSSMQLTKYSYQGGGILGSQFLGISLLYWIILLIVLVVIVVAAVVLVRRRRPPMPAPYPPQQPMMPPQPPMQPGPPGGTPPPPGTGP